MKSKYFLFFVAIMLLGSCKDSENPVIISQPLPIIPLNVGNEWEYQTTAFDSNGQQKYRSTDVSTIRAETTLTGETWYYGSLFPAHVTLRENGMWYKHLAFPFSYSQVDGEPGLVLPFPLKVNESATGYAGDKYTMIANNVSITTPAGTFKCFHYSIEPRPDTYGPDHHDKYFSPGVGLIKEIWSYDFVPGQGLFYQTGERILLSFKVK